MTVVAIDRILSQKSFGTIFAGKVVEGGPERLDRLVVVAKRQILFGDPAVGETWRVDGPLRRGPRGPQIEAIRASRVLPSGSLIKSYISHEISGVGPERAARLWKAYGTDIPDVLRTGDIASIADVMAPDRPILGPRLAATLVRAWQEAEAEVGLMSWAQSRGVDDVRAVRRIAKIFGTEAVSRLERNAWCLVPFLPWQKVDGLGLRLAREAGTEQPDDLLNRLVGAVDAAVKDLVETGATMSSDRDMRARVAAKLNVSRDHPRLEAAMIAGARNGAIMPSSNRQWRAPGCAMMEEAVLRHLRELSHVDGPPVRDGTPLNLEASIANYERSAGALHPEQREAVQKVLSRGFSCLQGGAGVGKTHVTKAICAVWEEAGGSVLLAALAGKAALRLHQATGRLARTLFRTIRELDERADIVERLSQEDVEAVECAVLKDRLRYVAEVTPRTLVVVDEASMVDIASLHALVRRMPMGARLLMVGDERQLPPVAAGLTYHRMVADAAITARLSVIHRQAGETGIPAFSAALRDRRLAPLAAYDGRPQDGVSLLLACTPEEIESGVIRVANELGQDDVMIVAPTNNRAAGVRSLNAHMHNLHLANVGGPELVSPLGERLSTGEPIIHLRNDYRRGLFNGSLGRVKSIDVRTNSLVAEFDGDEKEQVFTAGEAIDLSLGYALTCHRAQGSQGKRVVVALTPSRLLDPSWIYTAVTRAERQVVIVGDPNTLVDALNAPWASDRRAVGFHWTAEP